jgi:hypothetical protein
MFISLNLDQLSYTSGISKVHTIFHALLLRCAVFTSSVGMKTIITKLSHI